MLQHDVLGDGEAEAEAAGVLGAALVDAVEAAEDFFLLRFGDAFAVVAHAHLGGLAALRDRDLDRRAAAVLDRVVDQVRERLLEAQRVGLDGDVLARDDERGAVGEVFAQLVDELAQVDAKSFRVYRDAKEIKLAKKEFELLWLLVRNKGSVISRERILSEVWQMSDEVETRTVDAHVRNLRKKLGPERITTVVGFGYRYDPP